jgi:hypothetical protein
MKKIMFIAFGFLMTTGVSAFAQSAIKVAKDSTTTTVTTSTKTEPVKVEIKSIDLPQPIKDLGASFKSQGWDTDETAYVVKDATNQVVFYIVSFKNPTSGETKSINIDATGNIVKN